jgi:hypothetical protein
MTAEELEVGDIIRYTGKEYKIIAISTSNENIILDAGFMDFHTFELRFSENKITLIKATKAPQPKSNRQNNDGLSTCCFCGGATKKWQGLNLFVEHNVCVDCGK